MAIYKNCAGHTRRDFLQLGLQGLMGFGLCDLLRLKARATEQGKMSGKNINCIMIWLDGGPSHFETFDPKPDAPTDIRGVFKTVPTKVPGVHFSEPVNKLAGVFDKFTVVRSICHKDPNHGGGNHYMMTGAPTPVPVGCGAFVTFHPSMGSMVSYDRGVKGGLPAYMATPSNTRSGGPNFLGGPHAPFIIPGYPNSDAFRVNDVVLPGDIAEGRVKSRRDLRAALDRMKRTNDKIAEDPTVEFDRFYEQGFDLVSSAKAQEAFDIHREDPKIRERYGRNDMGQRRLTEPRRSEEQNVIERFAAVARGLDENLELAAYLFLSDVLLERFRPQRALERLFLGRGGRCGYDAVGFDHGVILLLDFVPLSERRA